LANKRNSLLDKNDLLKLIEYILVIQNNNYVTKKKKTEQDLLKVLDLTP